MKIEGVSVENKHGAEVTFFDPNNGKTEVGVISSYNNSFVFVRYGDSPNSQATKTSNLYWNDRKFEFDTKWDIIKMLNLSDILNVDNFDIETDVMLGANSEVYLFKNGKCFGTVDDFYIESVHIILNKPDEEKLQIRRNFQLLNLL